MEGFGWRCVPSGFSLALCMGISLLYLTGGLGGDVALSIRDDLARISRNVQACSVTGDAFALFPKVLCDVLPFSVFPNRLGPCCEVCDRTCRNGLL